MRAAFVTWLMASLLVSGFLATTVFYLALVGYFEAPDLASFSVENGELTLAIAFLVAGHLVARVAVAAPRCIAKSRSFGEAVSYREAPEVVDSCGTPDTCAKRTHAALHRRVAFGVGLSLPIGLIGFHAAHTHAALGGHSCSASPLHYGGSVLLYVALATLAVLSHAPTALSFSRA